MKNLGYDNVAESWQYLKKKQVFLIFGISTFWGARGRIYPRGRLVLNDVYILAILANTESNILKPIIILV